MAVNYYVFQQKFDMSGNDSKKFYARAQAVAVLNFKQLCAKISRECTVTKADVMAVLEGCISSMKEYLELGMIVRLGEFGSFQLSVSSEGALTEQEFTNDNITGSKIIFRPGKDVTELYNILEYNKVKPRNPTVAPPAEEGGTGGA